jgi:hypothetical protein
LCSFSQLYLITSQHMLFPSSTSCLIPFHLQIPSCFYHLLINTYLLTFKITRLSCEYSISFLYNLIGGVVDAYSIFYYCI